jgi:hypothetical protein
MTDARFLHLPLGKMQDGSRLEQARAAWLRGEVGLDPRRTGAERRLRAPDGDRDHAGVERQLPTG